jgi:hypothetical protein
MKIHQIARLSLLLVSGLLYLVTPSNLSAQDMKENKDKLAVLWVSGDRDVAEKSCLMYTHAAKKYGWFDEVVLIVWGPSSKLLAEDEKLQEKIKKMEKDGVILEACISCANMLGVTEELKELGINVKGMGGPLTDYLKSGYHVLTY